MAIAYFMAHYPRDFFPINNGADPAISFCFHLPLLAFAGPAPSPWTTAAPQATASRNSTPACWHQAGEGR